MNKNDTLTFFRLVKSLKRHYKMVSDKKNEDKYLQYRIIKSMHGFEKGLSLTAPRVGFGKDKMVKLLEYLVRYNEKGYDMEHSSIIMAIGALNEYVSWHVSNGNENLEVVQKCKSFLDEYPVAPTNKGGTLKIKRDVDFDFDSHNFSKLVMSRHSARAFSGETVDLQLLEEAIVEANQCPSACNRQPTKIHIISSKEGVEYMAKHLEGTGGFAEECDKFIIVSSDVLAFDFSECNQWVVSAGIFVGYLTLALHARGIGSCVIQRPLIRYSKIENLREKFHIPENEEVICAIGLGMYKEEFSVPSSTRLRKEEIISIH